MIKVRFHDCVEDSLLKFAVIIAKNNGKWIFCKHKERNTYEIPGGHREKGESIFDTAKRELQEETGAISFTINPICAYSVMEKGQGERDSEVETFGMLYYAEIFSFEQLHSEIECILITEKIIDNWTYPQIQPKLLQEAINRGY